MVHKKTVDGVHVQMDTFSSPSDRSFKQYDAAGNVILEADTNISSSDAEKEEVYDAEAQVIRDDFKRPPY